ncbi:MAG: hypothetical protein RL141_925 [Candidatus Parcubacteria bacterium]
MFFYSEKGVCFSLDFLTVFRHDGSLMKLVEFDGKQLFREAGIGILPGVLLPLDAAGWPAETPWPGRMMVKSQVLQGRRGKMGLIMPCATPDALASVLATLRERVGSTPCAGFFCEPMAGIRAEWFVSADIDRASADIRLSVSAAGGADVAAAATRSIQEMEQDVSLPVPVRQAALALASLLERADATHAEINPLAELEDGSFVALDAKVELDDAAGFRHPERAAFAALSPLGRALTEREQAYETFAASAGHRGTFGRYVELDGDIALILSGGGASIVALDALQAAGGRAANYLEASGNPDPVMLREAARIALARPGIRGVWVAGSFANFTDIQATCGAIRQAMDDLALSVPVVIRRDGPNAQIAADEAAAWAAARATPCTFHRADTSLEASARHLVSLLPV